MDFLVDSKCSGLKPSEVRPVARLEQEFPDPILADSKVA
jgi:hypothetical protein